MKNKVISFLESAEFGTSLLILSTLLEAFYSFSLFSITGKHTFFGFTIVVSLVYSLIISGTIVFFSLRNNSIMVWAAVVFEFAMNLLLDIQTVALSNNIDNKFWVFTSQLMIGSLLPIATKSFADEISKKYIKTRNAYEKEK
jgi:hypothetical protein